MGLQELLEPTSVFLWKNCHEFVVYRVDAVPGKDNIELQDGRAVHTNMHDVCIHRFTDQRFDMHNLIVLIYCSIVFYFFYHSIALNLVNNGISGGNTQQFSPMVMSMSDGRSNGE